MKNNMKALINLLMLLCVSVTPLTLVAQGDDNDLTLTIKKGPDSGNEDKYLLELNSSQFDDIDKAGSFTLTVEIEPGSGITLTNEQLKLVVDGDVSQEAKLYPFTNSLKNDATTPVQIAQIEAAKLKFEDGVDGEVDLSSANAISIKFILEDNVSAKLSAEAPAAISFKQPEGEEEDDTEPKEPKGPNKRGCLDTKKTMDVLAANGYDTTKVKEGIYMVDNVVHVFVGPDGKLIGGSKFPTTLPAKKLYQYKLIAVIKADKEEQKVKAKIIGTPYSAENINGFNVIENGIPNDAIKAASTDSSVDATKLCLFDSGEPAGPFSNKVTFKVLINDKIFYQRSTTITAKKTYIASVVGGFYVSTLNNPQNIQQLTINGTNTLIGDYTRSQRALTVMALFYPRPRYIDYLHKDLTFMQKWGFVFGTKLSDNIFDDLLLGLNYEFSKGASFSAGIHYGEHNVLEGYNNFEYGRTAFTGTFNNNMMTRQWDFGFFAGVTIDFSIIAAIGRGYGDRRVQQESLSSGNSGSDGNSGNGNNDPS